MAPSAVCFRPNVAVGAHLRRARMQTFDAAPARRLRASFGRSTGRSLCSKANARQKEGRRPMEWTTARPLSSRGRGKRTAHRSIRGGQPLRACRTATSVDGGRHRPDCASISTVRGTGVPAPCGVRVLPSLPRCRGWCSRGTSDQATSVVAWTSATGTLAATMLESTARAAAKASCAARWSARFTISLLNIKRNSAGWSCPKEM